MFDYVVIDVWQKFYGGVLGFSRKEMKIILPTQLEQ